MIAINTELSKELVFSAYQKCPIHKCPLYKKPIKEEQTKLKAKWRKEIIKIRVENGIGKTGKKLEQVNQNLVLQKIHIIDK